MKLLKQRSPAFIAFLQVIGVAAYVLIFASALIYVPEYIGEEDFVSPIVGITFFLLAFVTSALICGSLVLGYPIYLFLNNEKSKAITIVLWSVFWFVIVLLLIFSASLLAQDDKRYLLLGI